MKINVKNNFICMETELPLNDVLMPGTLWRAVSNVKYAYIKYKEGHDIFEISKVGETVFLSKMDIIDNDYKK
jgi:hypothetical protein